MYLMGVEIAPCKGAIFRGMTLLRAVQKWLSDQDAIWDVDYGGPRNHR